MDAMKERDRTRTMKGSLDKNRVEHAGKTIGRARILRDERGGDWGTYTRSPGESSVYNLSMVFDEPPAPAARVELGFETCEPAALRL